MPRFGAREDFHSLSVQDLLEARDHYHVHLSHRENVIGTAIGLYRIRTDDPDSKDPEAERRPGTGGARTLRNTVTRKWSWPCVLVFVDKWTPISVLRKSPSSMEDLVPSRLFLPDGRVVPTCVIYSPPVQQPPASLRRLTFPAGAIGGGYPILTDVQGDEHVGSIGCLVTDGGAVYGLTNRHVVGDPGTPIYTLLSGNRHEVGVTHRLQVGKKPFKEVFPSLGGAQSFANLDAGLIRVGDIRQWTSQIYGIGQLGALVNLTDTNISLDLIGCPVRAFGAASGTLLGSIMGLFFRYRTIGGADFVADLLIGPRDGDPNGPQTRPGDSGTVWCWDRAADKTESENRPEQEPLRPMAMQWGGQALLDVQGNQTQFALATSLSQICRELDVDVVRDWGIGLSEYWGKVGHYKVGAFACELVTSKKLRTLMLANQERIGVSDADLKAGKLPNNNQPEFVALADVADLVWRSKRGKDPANHFANMDAEGAGEFDGRTLMDLWFKQAASRNPQTWTAFYNALGAANGQPIADRHRGALPFRVAEIYAQMVQFVAAKDVTKFVCAAGLLAHYVGDACQPLHVSHLHHGRPGHPEESDVHSVYETSMLDQRRVELVDGVNTLLEQTTGAIKTFKGSVAAAHATVELMKKTMALIDPLEVIDAYNAEGGQERVPHMWNVLGNRTMKTIANGARALATIWQSAWLEGGGNSITAAKLVAVSKVSLRALYLKKTFLESNWLKDM
jgi:hypothetical protein